MKLQHTKIVSFCSCCSSQRELAIMLKTLCLLLSPPQAVISQC